MVTEIDGEMEPEAKETASPAPRVKRPRKRAADAAVTPVVAAPPVEAEPASPDRKKGKKKDKGKDKDKDKKKEKKGKEAVLVRFEREQLARIDARAASLGLNRAAWLRMTVAQVLANT
ncbi:MAG: hypothetical protein HQL34_11365 [Alphaproteobacteria bacterium]|nr:hypothetical protein [Alphaproteobacteria bacterium]